MRRLIGLVVTGLAAMGIAQPAMAADLGSALPAGLTTLASAVPASAGVAAPATATAAATVFDIVKLVTVDAQPASPDLRLHDLVAVMTSRPAAPLESQTARLRRGFGGSMADFYPLGIDGFHVSGGTRFYSRGPARAGVIDARGLVDMRYVTLLYAPRSVLARATRRMTPALTAGYTRLLQGGMSLGIEGGAMLGKFDTLAGSLVHPPRLRGDLGDGAGRLNQVARMTFGYHF